MLDEENKPIIDAEVEDIEVEKVEMSEEVEPAVNSSYYEPRPIIEGKKEPKRNKPFWSGFWGGLIGALVMVLILNSTAIGSTIKNTFSRTTSKTATEQILKANGAELSVVDISKKAGPAVVGIVVTTTQQNFLGTQEAEGSGSGFIIRQDGYIVTNNHVIEDAKTIKVITNTEKEYTAKLVGADAQTDLAVLKIDATGLTTVELGKSSELEVGEIAVAIGNPLGQYLAGTVTVGFISALNRTIPHDNVTYTLIQTDAAINPGNSGGALLNTMGQVVGINTVKVSGGEGLGFAIPIDNAKPIIDDLIANGYVKGRPVIGFTARRDITEEMSKYYGIPVGIYVGEVQAFSGAETAGMKTGDVIVSIDGKKCVEFVELQKMKEGYKVGDIINIGIKRKNDKGEWKDMSLKVKLAEDKSAKRN